MAKGQKRSTREAKKPKASKPAAAAQAPAQPVKGALEPTGMPKKKKG